MLVTNRATPSPDLAVDIEFRPNWRQLQTGPIRQGGQLTINYAPERLTGCRQYHDGMPAWDLFANVRFTPGGEFYSGNLVQHTGGPRGKVLDPPSPIPFTIEVPADATQVEMWFHNTDISQCSAWDSQYGQNYRFEVSQAGAAQPVMFRTGAERDLGMVNVFAEKIGKERHFFEANPPVGSELQTHLSLTAWVRNIAYEKNVWVDVHVFDLHDNLVGANTLTLHYSGPAGGNGDFFALNETVFQGSGGVAGSVWPRPDARRVQYRLYYQVDGRVFTDGVLHQHAVEADGIVTEAVATAA